MSEPIRVDMTTAKECLRIAIDVSSAVDYSTASSLVEDISTIMLGSHKTYRYILITALLGKATDSRINPLCLQAGSELEGAYDARSLCHSVVVPIERESLDNALGGSNEPFLNKPARFPEISLSNAVRRGSDAELLRTLHSILSDLQEASGDHVFSALCDALYFANQRRSNLFGLLANDIEPGQDLSKLLSFAECFASSSIEGQTCPILLGTILEIFFKQISNEIEIHVHPINQSGASSREISDIDIKLRGAHYLSIEVKDKDFTREDVEHAANKVLRASHNQLLIAAGQFGTLLGSEESALSIEFAEKGVNLFFADVLEVFHILLGLCGKLEVSEFFQTMKNQALNARVKEEVIHHMEQCAIDLELIG